MMSTRAYFATATGLAGAGVAFSGYLSATRFFANTCAFDESCAMILDVPACYVGFVLFASLLVVSSVGRRVRGVVPIAVNAALAAVGVLFAGYVATTDLLASRTLGAPAYALGLPTCAYGAVFFTAMLVLSARALRRSRRSRPAPKGDRDHAGPTRARASVASR